MRIGKRLFPYPTINNSKIASCFKNSNYSLEYDDESDNDNLSFLYWFNINDKTQYENIKHYLENNLKIGLMKGSNEKCLIAVWLGYEK